MNCARCQRQLRVCRHCDHGQRYCPEPCARQARRACVRAAGRRYQQSFRGRWQHARLKGRWRTRRCEKVTHHSFLPPTVSAKVDGRKEVDADVPKKTSEGRDCAAAGSAEVLPSPGCAPRRCVWCGRPAQRWVRRRL